MRGSLEHPSGTYRRRLHAAVDNWDRRRSHGYSTKVLVHRSESSRKAGACRRPRIKRLQRISCDEFWREAGKSPLRGCLAVTTSTTRCPPAHRPRCTGPRARPALPFNSQSSPAAWGIVGDQARAAEVSPCGRRVAATPIRIASLARLGDAFRSMALLDILRGFAAWLYALVFGAPASVRGRSPSGTARSRARAAVRGHGHLEPGREGARDAHRARRDARRALGAGRAGDAARRRARLRRPRASPPARGCACWLTAAQGLYLDDPAHPVFGARACEGLLSAAYSPR